MADLVLDNGLSRAMRDNISRHIAQNGFTKRAVAEKIGIPKSTLCRSLQTRTAEHGPGTYSSDLDWLWMLCDVLNTDPTTLLGWTPPEEPSADESGSDPSPF